MKEYIMMTDTHIGFKSNDYGNQVHLDFFKHVCNTAKERNIKEMIHLGDWFDDRKVLNVKHTLDFTLNELVPLLTDTFDKIYLLLGNHDVYFKDKNEVNSLSIFKYIDNFIIVDKPMVIDGHMKLFPGGYVPDKEEDKDYVCRGHWEINGAVINASGKVATGFKYNLSDFKGIKYVESGHFHTPGDYGNICYIGAPYHMDHNDRGERAYYIITEKEKDTIIYNGPEFMDLYISVKEDIDISKITSIYEDIYITKNNEDSMLLSDIDFKIEDNHIRLVYMNELGSTLTSQVNEYIHSFNPKTVKVKFSFTDNEDSDTEEVIEISDDEKDLLMKYVSTKNPPSHINKNVLKGLIQKIIEEDEDG